MECCPDFRKVCTVAASCEGRCFEAFERGRECDCDADCERYGKCCPDYTKHCKEESKNDEKDLCSGKPADGMVALPNGTLAVFRGHYYWLLNGRTPPSTNPRRISDGWGIPSPIDSGPLYWRFTNGVMDKGYPKPLATGFAGLSGRIVATLPVARYNNRPESVYFIKRDGNMQQYVYRQEPAKRCQRRARVTIRYPAFVPRVVIRRRFQRAVHMPTVVRTVRINVHPSGNVLTQHCVWEVLMDVGVLRKEIQMQSYWRGLPKVIHSTLSVPNQNKPDGYDYYAFSYNRYYSLDIGKRIARPVTALTGKTVSKDWYNCPSKRKGLELCLQQPGALTPLPVELPATHARPQCRGLQPDTAQGLGLGAARVCGGSAERTSSASSPAPGSVVVDRLPVEVVTMGTDWDACSEASAEALSSSVVLELVCTCTGGPSSWGGAWMVSRGGRGCGGRRGDCGGRGPWRSDADDGCCSLRLSRQIRPSYWDFRALIRTSSSVFCSSRELLFCFHSSFSFLPKSHQETLILLLKLLDISVGYQVLSDHFRRAANVSRAHCFITD
ncbi:Proteoglycan 4, partial [Lamprotornis superbus]